MSSDTGSGTTRHKAYVAWTNGFGAMIARTLVVVQAGVIALGAWGLNTAWGEIRDWMKQTSGDIRAINEKQSSISTEIELLKQHDAFQERLQTKEK